MKYWKQPGLLLTLGFILFLSLLLGFAEMREEEKLNAPAPKQTLILEEESVPLARDYEDWQSSVTIE